MSKWVIRIEEKHENFLEGSNNGSLYPFSLLKSLLNFGVGL